MSHVTNKQKLNGTFSTTNPVDGKMYHFDLFQMGWLSRTGCFHFSPKTPKYAKNKAVELFLSQMQFVNNIVNI